MLKNIINYRSQILIYPVKIDDALHVRTVVFQQEQGIDRNLDFDGKDTECVHVVVYDEKTPVGTRRMRKVDDKTMKIERVAVIATYRGKGIGKMIMQTMDEYLQKNGVKKATLDAQLHAKKFYENLGYTQEGKIFEEVGIPHVVMTKKFKQNDDKVNEISTLTELASTIENQPLTAQLKSIRDTVYLHARKVGGPFEVKSILTSRFLPAQEAFEKGYISCGTLVNIAASVLRQLGSSVKLIHGSTAQTPTHAWLAVNDSKTGAWNYYDITRKDFSISTEHRQEYSVDDWNEIKDVIEAIYNKNHKTADL